MGGLTGDEPPGVLGPLTGDETMGLEVPAAWAEVVAFWVVFWAMSVGPSLCSATDDKGGASAACLGACNSIDTRQWACNGGADAMPVRLPDSLLRDRNDWEAGPSLPW